MTSWRHALARALYSAVLALALPGYLLRLWWRGRAEPLYRQAMAQRLGRYAGKPSMGWVWVHAVSLGETRAAAALIDALRLRKPGLRLLLTHGTATGFEAGRSLLRDGDAQTWLPYDMPSIVARFLAQFRPAVGVLMETEIWPGLLLAARAAAVPMVLANARLSEKSRSKGTRFDVLLRPAIESLAIVLAQTEADAQRLGASGAREVVVCGNLKFDVTPDPVQLSQGKAWRSLLQRKVVLAAITREGEEAMVLAAWAGVAEPRPLLVIVPRHPQRFDEVAELVHAGGLTLARRSAWAETPPAQALQAQVWLGDSMREMALYYAVAGVALLGGSFARLGGHNLIEAAACGCPVVMGPHTFNFADAADMSIEAGAAVRAVDMPQALERAMALLAPDVNQQVSASAVRFAARHRGAAARMAERIVGLMRH